ADGAPYLHPFFPIRSCQFARRLSSHLYSAKIKPKTHIASARFTSLSRTEEEAKSGRERQRLSPLGGVDASSKYFREFAEVDCNVVNCPLTAYLSSPPFYQWVPKA